MMQGPQMQQLRQRVIASYHLGPLDKAETQAYIEHRLAHVGWKGDPRFEPAAFDLIHAASGGIPRRINTLCNRLLLAGFLGEKHAFDAADVQAIAREIREELGAGSDARGRSAMPATRLRRRADARGRPSADAGAWLAAFPRHRGADRPPREDRRQRRRPAATLLHPERSRGSRGTPAVADGRNPATARDRWSASSARARTT